MHKIKKIPDSKIEIEVILPAQELEKFFDLALENIKNNFESPGFRKGTVPEKIIMEQIGESRVLEEAAERAVRDSWFNIMQEEQIEPISHPEISITKIARGNPLEFKIKATLLGEIALPDYKKIAQKIVKDFEKKESEISATEEEIQKALDYVKNRPEAWTGDEEKLKNTIRENVVYEKKLTARSDARIKILEEINSGTKTEIPEMLVDGEKEKMMEELKSSVAEMGMAWDQYLANLKNRSKAGTEDDLKKEWRDQALKRVRFGLILREIAKKENMQPSSALLEEETNKILRSLKEEERQKASPESIRKYLFGRLQNEIVFDFLQKTQ